MRENIIKYLSNFDLDVRKSQDARFMDQKCTPDVVCFIADCIINIGIAAFLIRSDIDQILCFIICRHNIF